jgi:phage shock protein PspC (stress-responsive transcriptional regulator)
MATTEQTEQVDPPFVTSRLVRPRRDRVVGGVAAGLGDYLGFAPVVFRVGFVVLTLAGGSGVALYGLAWLLIPEEGSHRSPGADLLNRIERRERLPVAALVVSVLCALLLLRGLSRPFRGGPPLLLPLVLVGLVAIAVSRSHAREPRDSAPGVTPWWLWTVGGVLVILGGIQLVLGWSWGWVALGVLVTGGVALAVAGRRWLAAGALLVLLAGTITGATWQLGVGDRTYQPEATLTGHRSYHLGAGRLTLDLTALGTDSRRLADLDASVGVGQVVIVVPPGMAAQVDGSAGIGDVILFGQRSSGTGVRRVSGTGTGTGTGTGAVGRSLRIHTKVGIGEVVVENEPVAGG